MTATTTKGMSKYEIYLLAKREDAERLLTNEKQHLADAKAEVKQRMKWVRYAREHLSAVKAEERAHAKRKAKASK